MNSVLCPTGNIGEAALIFRHDDCINYCKQHYAKRRQFKHLNDGWAIVFNTQGQVKRAIQHLEKKFKFDAVENWE